MSEKSNDSNESDTIRDRLHTRENSTLTIAITTFSASLAILFIPNLSEFRIFGLMPSLLGILYREFTIFYSDRRDYDRLHELEGREREKIDRRVRGFRSFIFRFLLALPIIIFVQIKFPLFFWLGVFVVTLSLSVFVFLEDSIMFDC